MIDSSVCGLQQASSAMKTRANTAHLYLEYIHFEQELQGLFNFPLKRFLGVSRLIK